MEQEPIARRPIAAHSRGDDSDPAGKRRERRNKRKEDARRQLDADWRTRFPGSDPVAITQPPHSARDKRRP